jgi:omega-amidase
MPSPPRIAIAQIGMRWTVAENLAAIDQAMGRAHAEGATLCAFPELAVTGFHREIAREAQPERVDAAIRSIRDRAARLGLGVAVGAPTFGDDGARFNAHLLIDERGAVAAEVRKSGLTEPEATFFTRGTVRPVGQLQGLRCSAVICREVSDLDSVCAQLPPGSVDLIFVPGALRQDPAQPRTDPPAYVNDIRRLAAATRSHVVHTNWPNALNRPEESIDAGGSTVADPRGDVVLRLPMRASGIGVFCLGDRGFDWHPH